MLADVAVFKAMQSGLGPAVMTAVASQTQAEVISLGDSWS